MKITHEKIFAPDLEAAVERMNVILESKGFDASQIVSVQAESRPIDSGVWLTFFYRDPATIWRQIQAWEVQPGMTIRERGRERVVERVERLDSMVKILTTDGGYQSPAPNTILTIKPAPKPTAPPELRARKLQLGTLVKLNGYARKITGLQWVEGRIVIKWDGGSHTVETETMIEVLES